MNIEIGGISKEFGVTAALHPMSLTIPSGTLVALLGPLGSGKTTLLRTLGGLEFPTAGRALFDGRDAPGRRPISRGNSFRHGRRRRPRPDRLQDPARADAGRDAARLAAGQAGGLSQTPCWKRVQKREAADRTPEWRDAFYLDLTRRVRCRNVTSKFSMERLKASTILPIDTTSV